MRVRQTQLMLIIDNLNVPLQSKPTVYQDVTDAWTKSLVLLDKLISGVPQSVESGEALLGLCAWHIYPDICALGKTTTLVDQNDNLIKKGGLVTIGLNNLRNTATGGISWSMPLAHLRYYGKAVMSHGVIDSQKTRVPFDRIIQVAMGSMLSTWDSQYSNFEEVAQFLIALAQITQTPHRRRKLWLMGWLTMLSEQAYRLLHSHGSEKTEMVRYIALGRRRFGKFLAKTEFDHHPHPCFGLNDPNVFLESIESERAIASLRTLYQQSGNTPPERAIIRRAHPKTIDGFRILEYATLVPQQIPGFEGKRHRRWLILPTPHSDDSLHNDRRMEDLIDYPRFEHEIIKRSLTIIELHGEPCGFLDDRSMTKLELKGSSFIWTDRAVPRSLEYLMRYCLKPDPADYEEIEKSKRIFIGWQIGHLDHEYMGFEYQLLIGNSTTVAVYDSVSTTNLEPSNPHLSMQFITHSINSGHMDLTKLLSHFVPQKHIFELDRDDIPYDVTFLRSLVALARARKLYLNLPEAEVDLNVASITLWSTKWAANVLDLGQREMTRTASFACVAMFDTGCLDLDLNVFDEVIAVSSANNIYASEILSGDPWQLSTSNLRHVTGNVGKPGLALLLSPGDTILREPDLETWELVNHVPYDGKCEDNFKATSLHLSLTGYEQPLNTGEQGRRDKEAYYIEAVVSAYDRGTWVADLDLLYFVRRFGAGWYNGSAFARLPNFCAHDAALGKNTSAFAKLTSIDNWYEFQDAPKNAAVIRASRNWVARLALAATHFDKGYILIIAFEDICWACVQESVEERKGDFEKIFVLC